MTPVSAPPMRPVPTREELGRAYGRSLPDLVAPGLRLLLVGINPSLYSAVTGNHFGRPSNRLWEVLWRAGLTSRRLQPHEQSALLAEGIGVTNIVARATARADELTDDEIRAGLPALARRVRRVAPQVVAILGVGAWRTATNRRDAGLGPQAERLGGRPVWVLPNPSGLNAHYQLPDLVRLYGELAVELDRSAAAS
jgi:TDG/mug DNA glycosylase family protein